MSRILILAAALLAIVGCSSSAAPVEGHAAPVPGVATTAITPTIDKAITATVARMAPKAKVQAIIPSPIPGLYQVVVQGQVMYLTGDGRYVLQGDVIDVATRTSVNGVTMNRLRSEAIAKLDPAQMIRFAPTHPKYTVTVFTDIDCPYCRALHANIAKINALGIAVDYLFWPRTGLDTPSARKAVAVWCAADRHTALTDAFDGHQPAAATCPSPLTRDFNLGIDLGIEGTPMIIASNGVVLGGYVEPLELLRRLQSIESQRASH